ncbi:MAG: Na+/H+ antiporter subunit E [Planctomycetes bacterium]|nr:Na+/H+ antiporter subunit E [Planctomycetota bacterium]
MKRLLGFVGALLLWLLLFWSLNIWVIAAGVGVAAVATALLGSIAPDGLERVLCLRRVGYFLLYLPYFLYYCVRANFDVMLRVVHPDVPIRPGIVKLPTTLKSEMAKTFLANSITLTPGTLTLDIDGQDMYVHWINIDTDDVKKRTAEICGRFEPMLRRIFE